MGTRVIEVFEDGRSVGHGLYCSTSGIPLPLELKDDEDDLADFLTYMRDEDCRDPRTLDAGELGRAWDAFYGPK